MRAPFAYYGGKTGMASLIANLLPAHRVYIEPFFGSGAVLFAKTPATFEIVNDLDGALVNFFRVLRERTEDLEAACTLTPHARDEFNAADLDDDSADDVERARRFWVRVNQSFAKTAGRQTGWSITTGRTQSVPASIASRVGRFAECAARLASVSIENCDAADLVDRLATTDSAIYVDPPYVHSTRAARMDRKAPADYRCDMGGEDDHRRLAEVLRSTPAAVILSGYPAPLYDELYGDWCALDLAVAVHSSNALTHTRGSRIERLWSNRDLNEGRLFDLTEVALGTRSPGVRFPPIPAPTRKERHMANQPTEWWSPHRWPGGALMSWDSVGTVIIGAIFVVWWGMSDDEVYDALYIINGFP